MKTIKKFLKDTVKHYGEILGCGNPPIVYGVTKNVVVDGKTVTVKIRFEHADE